MEIERRGNTFTAKVRPLHLDEITSFKYIKVNRGMTHQDRISLKNLANIVFNKEDLKAKFLEFLEENLNIAFTPEIIRNLEIKHKDGTNIPLRISADGRVYWAWESNSDYRPTIPVRKLVFCYIKLEGDFKNEDLILNYEMGFLPRELEVIYYDVPTKSDATDGSLLTSAYGTIGKRYMNNHVDPIEREMEYSPVEIHKNIFQGRSRIEGVLQITVLGHDVRESFDQFPYHHPERPEKWIIIQTYPPQMDFKVRSSDLENSKAWLEENTNSRVIREGKMFEIMDPTPEAVEEARRLLEEELVNYKLLTS